LVDAPLDASLPLAPSVVPALDPPLGALELVLSELDGAVAPEVLEPYCFMQSARSVPLMPTHWLGVRSVLAPLVLDESLVLGEVELEPLLEVP
jgi:hypothetical protein